MTTEAIIVMVLAMLIVWGGLAMAVLHLRNTTPPSLDEIRRDL